MKALMLAHEMKRSVHLAPRRTIKLRGMASAIVLLAWQGGLLAEEQANLKETTMEGRMAGLEKWRADSETFISPTAIPVDVQAGKIPEIPGSVQRMMGVLIIAWLLKSGFEGLMRYFETKAKARHEFANAVLRAMTPNEATPPQDLKKASVRLMDDLESLREGIQKSSGRITTALRDIASKLPEA